MVKPKIQKKGKSGNTKLSITNPGHSGDRLIAQHDLSPLDLIAKAVEATNGYEPRKALKFYKSALDKLENQNPSCEKESAERLKLVHDALQSSAFILLESGAIEEAKQNLLKAVSLCPDYGHEKFMYLAQLSEKQEAVNFYQRGINLLTAEIQTASKEVTSDEKKEDDDETPRKMDLKRALSNAFCATSEIYMTDLCDEPEAELSCLHAIESATLYDPENPQAWLSTANFRTVKAEDQAAKEALERCLSLYWPRVEQLIAEIQVREEKQAEDLQQIGLDALQGDDEEANRLDLEEISGITFEAHVSMAQMMIELDMHEQAVNVLEALLEEDDECSTVYYLLTVIGQKLWKESDPDRLREYATAAKGLGLKEHDSELVVEMEQLLATLPKDEIASLHGDNDDDEISSSGDEDEEKQMDTI